MSHTLRLFRSPEMLPPIAKRYQDRASHCRNSAKISIAKSYF
jgi:hypothetical protein